MEIYILDSLLRRAQVVDKFDSLIWTERFQELGDFELVIQSTREARGQFVAGTLLAVNTSWRVMVVETVQHSVDGEGKSVLSVKGRSLELMLEDRIAKDTLGNLTVDPKWNLTGTPGNIARKIFNDICIEGQLHAGDKIPFIMTGTIMPTSTSLETSTPITVALPPQTVLAAIKGLCDTYDLGYRLVRNFDNSQLYFEIYSGNDRTTRQSIRPPVVFALQYDNLLNITELTTIEKTKNVAYVFSEFGSLEVYGSGVLPDVAGFERRVLLVNAIDIDDDTPPSEIPSLLQQQGEAALFAARTFAAFDGEINRSSPYQYGINYELGDIVEVRNEDGVVTYKRVTEQIFVSDTEGERAYPTLTMNMFVNQNTWLFQKNDKTWAEYTSEIWTQM